MHADDEHLLIIGAIVNADAPTFRQAAGRAPEKVVFQVLGARVFEAKNLAALRVDAGQDVLDGAILAGGVHRLKNQQNGVLVLGVEQTLLPAQGPGMFGEDFLIVLLRLVEGLYPGRPLPEFDFLALANAESLRLDFHGLMTGFEKQYPTCRCRFNTALMIAFRAGSQAQATCRIMSSLPKGLGARRIHSGSSRHWPSTRKR